MKKTIPRRIIGVAMLLAIPVSLTAQSTTLSQVVDADTFVSSGQPTVNFGTMGAMEIAGPTAAQNRYEETLLRFNLASIVSGFNTTYGAGNWQIDSVTLSLFSNVATSGQQPNNGSLNKIAAGNFEFDWLSNDSWSETGITWNSLSTVLPGTGNNSLASLGTFYWPATGDASATWTLGLDPNFTADIAGGGEVTIFGQPSSASTVGYLFNTLANNPASINVTASPVPEPSVYLTLLATCGGLAGWSILRRPQPALTRVSLRRPLPRGVSGR